MRSIAQLSARLLAVVFLMFGLLGWTTSGWSQALPPFSVVAQQNGAPGPTGLTTLPGLNDAQQAMAQSINNVCPTINSIALTPDQRQLATVCSAMLGTAVQLQGQPNPLGAPSLGISAGALAGALESLNGAAEIVIPTSQSSSLQIQESNMLGGVVEARLSALRNPLAGSEFAGLPWTGQLAQATPAWTSDAAAPGYRSSGPVTGAYQSGRLGLYVNGIGQFGDRDASSRQNGFSFNNTGVVAGADYRFTPRFSAGAAFSYTHNNTDFDTSAISPPGQSIQNDLFQGTVYATYSVTDALYVNGNVMFGGGNTDSRRHIVIPSNNPAVPAIDSFATGSYGIGSDSVNIGTGYIMPFGALTLTPTARFQYLRANSDGFTETGAGGLNLTYGGDHHNSYLSFIGGQAQYAWPTWFGTVYPTARFEWAHQYNSSNTAVSVAYTSDPLLLSTFTFPADKVDRNYFDLGVGLAMQLSPTQSAFVTYDAIVGLRNTTYNSFIAGVRIIF
jgi:outer membrane autotransporter protein